MKSEIFNSRRFRSRNKSQKKKASSNSDKEKRDLIYYTCKKLGHIKYDCSL